MTEVKVNDASFGNGEPHLAALLGRVFEAMRRTLRTEDWGGLRPVHFRLLEAVPLAGTTITELAPVLFMTKQAVGQFVTSLVNTGHLEVRVDPNDRRRRLVALTVQGERTVAAVAARMHLLEQEWAQRVGEQRYREFRSVLDQLSQGYPESSR